MHYFVLVDCNNFYVSCERLFNPRLAKQPVVVLSNNDGCVISRSQEAKNLGVKMGDPFFKIEKFCLLHNISVYSSNYSLYGDISSRIMRILKEDAEDIEVYSIDEAFLMYSQGEGKALLTHCLQLRKKIHQWVGIPTSFGIAPTKTLAKIASKLAKKDPSLQGVFDLTLPATQEKVLRDFPLGDVWGIGSRLEIKFRSLGIFTAGQLREQEPIFIRKKFGVVGERMLWELRGISCLPLEKPVDRKSITHSRSFGKTVVEKKELEEALATYVSQACVKLRKQQSAASALSVFFESLLDAETGQRHYDHIAVPFTSPTSDTSQVIHLAKRCLNKLFQQGARYKKCGVILLDLIPEAHVRPDFFMETDDPKRKRLATAVDSINARYGKNTLFYGAVGVDPKWKMRSLRRSPFSTTSWDHLAVVS